MTEETRSTYEVNLKAAQDAHKVHEERWRDFNKSAIDAANTAIRSSILINGGSAVAILTFVGGLTAQGRVAQGQLTDIASSLFSFALGVAFALITAVGAYFVNVFDADMLGAQSIHYEHPYVRETPKSNAMFRTRSAILMLSILIGFASIFCFIWGIVSVRSAITSLALIPTVQK
ncbi:MAG: hypothetical protein HY242_09135 [Afipia sp.]|nr:hypothetical protein [Afipia sp.]